MNDIPVGTVVVERPAAAGSEEPDTATPGDVTGTASAPPASTATDASSGSGGDGGQSTSGSAGDGGTEQGNSPELSGGEFAFLLWLALLVTLLGVGAAYRYAIQ